LFATPEQLTVPHDNITPGQAVAVVRNDRDGRRRLDWLRWGLVPFWAKDEKIGYKLINARLETLAEKPAYREAATRRRCLIPASGFFEWGEGAERARRPHFARTVTEPLLALAGLWERWRAPDGTRLETCVIVTTTAGPVLAPIHDRMPVLVARPDHAAWLDAGTPAASIAPRAARGLELQTWPVGLAVNDPRIDDERVIAPEREAT
jgi:putative SOS response-associated peptidase YedK